jgi:ABC-type sugar transport system substrate-binding protein
MNVGTLLTSRGFRRLAALVVLAAVGVVAAQSAAGSPATKAAAAAASSCGVIPNGPLKDPNHLVAKLSTQLHGNYKGLPYQILPSAYTHWRPKHGPPWTIGFLDGPLAQPYNSGLNDDMNFWAQKLKADGLVKNWIALAAPDYTAATQIQQFNSLIEKKVDLVIVEPNVTTALVPEIQAAYKAGIPTVTTSGVVESPYAVNWTTNPWLNGAEPTAFIAKNYMHSKGNIITVEGAPTAPTAIAGLQGAEAALSNCPNIKVVNSSPLDGMYSESTAKSVVLEFLASYHGTINGVFDGGVQSQGILSAFQQLGKPVPAITNLGCVLGTIAYWQQHVSTFGSACTGSGGYEFDRIPVDIAMRLLEGKGPRLNTIIAAPFLITPANLHTIVQYNKSKLNVNNVNIADVAPFSLFTTSQLNGFFVSPGVKGPVGLDQGTASGLSAILQAP